MEQRGLRLIDNPVGRAPRGIEGAGRHRARGALRRGAGVGHRGEETERVETALGLLASLAPARVAAGDSSSRSPGGYAFRAGCYPKACARLIERPVRGGSRRRRWRRLRSSHASGPVSRPGIARASAAWRPTRPSPVSWKTRGGAEAGQSKEGGAIRYESTPLFERVFGLTGLSELPRLDDLAEDGEESRRRLEGSRRPPRSLGGGTTLSDRFNSSRVKPRRVSVRTGHFAVRARGRCHTQSRRSAPRSSRRRRSGRGSRRR